MEQTFEDRIKARSASVDSPFFYSVSHKKSEKQMLPTKRKTRQHWRTNKKKKRDLKNNSQKENVEPNCLQLVQNKDRGKKGQGRENPTKKYPRKDPREKDPREKDPRKEDPRREEAPREYPRKKEDPREKYPREEAPREDPREEDPREDPREDSREEEKDPRKDPREEEDPKEDPREEEKDPREEEAPRELREEAPRELRELREDPRQISLVFEQKELREDLREDPRELRELRKGPRKLREKDPREKSVSLVFEQKELREDPREYPREEYPKEEYPKEEYPREEYPREEYPREEYPREEYPRELREEYPREEYPREEYPREEYPREEYPREEYPREEYPREEYPREEYPREEYPREEYPREEYPREEYPRELREEYPRELREEYPRELREEDPTDLTEEDEKEEDPKNHQREKLGENPTEKKQEPRKLREKYQRKELRPKQLRKEQVEKERELFGSKQSPVVLQYKEVLEEQTEELLEPKQVKCAATREPPTKDKPYYLPKFGIDWQPIEWNQKVCFQIEDVWLLPINPFFSNEELSELEEERKKTEWNQNFGIQTNTIFPIRHLSNFESNSVSALVSNFGTSSEGKGYCQQSKELRPITRQIINRINTDVNIRNPLISETEINSMQENLYRGVPQVKCSLCVGTPDNICKHNDGDQVKEDSPIVTACLGNADGELRVVRNLKYFTSDEGEQFYLPNSYNTGYVMGGKNFQKYYYHMKQPMKKYLDPTEYCLSYVFRSLHNPTNKRQSTNNSQSIPIKVNWNNLHASQIWIFEVYYGIIHKDWCDSYIREINQHLIEDLHPFSSTWLPGLQLKTTKILQLLHIHPVSRNAGIAGNGMAVSIYISNNIHYENSIFINNNTNKIIIQYQVSKLGKTRLIKSGTEGIPIRVFLGPNGHSRNLFIGESIIYLGNFTIDNCNDQFCTLSCPISKGILKE